MSDVTCSVKVYECLAVDIIMETLAAVLLQLNLFYVNSLSDHLVPIFSSKEVVSQFAIYCNGPPLLSDLVSSLIGENKIQYYKTLGSKVV